jgi:hypothetical protein
MNFDLLATPLRRRALLCALCVCEGAPIGYLWTALPTKRRTAGVPVEEIAALGAQLAMALTILLLARELEPGDLVWLTAIVWLFALALLPGIRARGGSRDALAAEV